MYRNQNKWIQIALMVIDCSISILAFIIAGLWRYQNFLDLVNIVNFKEIVLVIILSSFGGFIVCGMFRDFFRRGYLHEFNRISIYSLLIVLLISLYSFATQNTMALSRLTLLYFLIINEVLIYTVHIVIKRISVLHAKRKAGWKLLIITDLDSVAATCRNIQNSSLKDRAIGLYMIDNQAVDHDILNGIPVINPDNGIIDFITYNPVDEVLLSIEEYQYVSDEIQTIKNRIVNSGAIFSLRIWSPVKDAVYVARLVEFGNDYVLSFANRTYDYFSILLKRFMDILAGIIGSVITILLSLFLIPAILIESPGPVFFRQKRVGRNGRIFTILKFRSMYKDAEKHKAKLMEKNKMKGLLFKIDDDPRVTKVGKFIRKTSLDEFPQFFNVLVGDMSVVGTRPPTLDEYKHYSCAQKKRLSFRPGITGIWQTSGRNNITSFDDVLQMDLQYIRDWSIYLDIKLILKTIVVVLLRKGAK